MKLTVFLCAAFISATLAATTLEEDFQDFAALIPEDEIRDIARRYLATDPEFKAAVAYLQGPEFAELVREIRQKEAVKEFEEYFIEAGVDIVGFFEYIHNLIMGAETRLRGESRSLKGFLDEVKRTLPIGKLIRLFSDKMKNSPAFQAFFEKVSSEDSHQMVEEIKALPEVQRLNKKLKEMGIEVERYMKIIYAIFGWQ